MPAKFHTIAPLVAILTLPGGLKRATSARNNPFQPMADAPNARNSNAVRAGDQAGVIKVMAPQHTTIAALIAINNVRQLPKRSAIQPHAMRPVTPAPCATDSITPAATRP